MARDWRYETLKFAGIALGVPYFRPRVAFTERPPTGGFIVACSHVTLLDWAAIAYAFRRPVRFLITRNYYDRALCHPFCRWGGAIPIHARGIEPSAARAAVVALRRGEIVGIFPEGALSATGRLQRMQRGVARLAMQAHCPVLPATIRGAFEAFPRHRWWPRPRRVVIAFGSALLPEAVPTNASARRRAETGFLETLAERIATLADATR